MLRTSTLLLLLCLPLSAIASSPVAIHSAEPFAQQQARITADLAKGKLYSEISRQDRQQVNDALDRISTALGADSSVVNLPAEQRTRIEQDQTLVNTLLERAKADSRQICSQQKIIGSNRAQSVCTTVAQQRIDRQKAQDALNRATPVQIRESANP